MKCVGHEQEVNDLRDCIESLRLTHRGFARFIGYNEETVRAWIRGRTYIPPQVLEWIVKMKKFLEENPLPGKSS